MIRILHLLPTSQPGGGPRHVSDLMWNLPTGLIRSGLVAPDGPLRNEIVAAGFPTFEADLHRLRWRTWRQVVRAALAFRPDVIHSHGKGPGLYGRILARGLGIPSVHTFHGWHLPRRHAAWYIRLERWLARRTDALIHVAPSEADEADRLKFRPRQSWVIPNGIDAEYVRTQAGPAYPHEVPSIGCMARQTDPVKHIDHLKHAVATWGKGVLMLPNSQAAFRPDFYRLIDIYASASAGEGLPYAMLDAMACGLPVVATRVRGHTDLVRHGMTGFLTSPGHPHEMAAYFDKLADPEARRQLGENGRVVIETDHRLDDMVRRTADCYRAVLGRDR